jgi:hypothetical protein
MGQNYDKKFPSVVFLRKNYDLGSSAPLEWGITAILQKNYFLRDGRLRRFTRNTTLPIGFCTTCNFSLYRRPPRLINLIWYINEQNYGELIRIYGAVRVRPYPTDERYFLGKYKKKCLDCSSNQG